jgi:hypothetical protein
MSVVIPTRIVNPTPLPQFVIRSRREPSSRDVANAGFIESWNSSSPVLQPTYRPSRQLAYLINRKDDNFYDQNGIPSRNQQPLTVPSAPFDPHGDKLEGNSYFDQYSPRFDPRNAMRELKSVVVESRADKGIAESQRILTRNFSGRYLSPSFAEDNRLNSLRSLV